MEEGKSVLVVAHGDLDGVVSAAMVMKRYGLQPETTEIRFTQPFLLDKVEVGEAKELFVVDIAVNNRDPEITSRFIKKNWERIVEWVDHHQGWSKVLGVGMDQTCDNKFNINPQVGSCAQILNPRDEWSYQLVADATAADTRQGQLSERGRFIDEAMKANLSDDSVRESAVRWIVNGCEEDENYQKLQRAQAEYRKVQEETEKLVKRYEIRDGIAVVDVRETREDYDRTQLLLRGEQMALTKTAVLLGKNPEGEEIVTVATMDKERNLVNLFGLPSGATFRVSLPVSAGWTVEKVLNLLTK